MSEFIDYTKLRTEFELMDGGGQMATFDNGARYIIHYEEGGTYTVWKLDRGLYDYLSTQPTMDHARHAMYEDAIGSD